MAITVTNLPWRSTKQRGFRVENQQREAHLGRYESTVAPVASSKTWWLMNALLGMDNITYPIISHDILLNM